MVAGLWATAVLYGYVHGANPMAPLPPLDLVDTVILSALSAVLSAPPAAFLAWLTRRAGRAEFLHAHPDIAAELARRRALEEQLAEVPAAGLRQMVATVEAEATHKRGVDGPVAEEDNSSDIEDEDDKFAVMEDAGMASPRPAFPAAIGDKSDAVRDPALSPRSVPTASETTSVTLSPRTRVLNPFKPAYAAAKQAKGGSQGVTATVSGDSEGDGFEFDWIDAPYACTMFCPLLLRCCRRHPSQKAAYLRRRRAQEAKEEALAAKRGILADEPASATPHDRLAAVEAAVERSMRPPITLPFCIGDAITLTSLVAYAAHIVFLAFCVYYLALFSLIQTPATLASFLSSWALTVTLSLCLLEPAKIAGRALFFFVWWPLNAPYITWIPFLGVGSMLARWGVRAPTSGAPTDSLAGRMESLTLVRAAGVASQLSPEAALVAFGAAAAVAATMRGLGGLVVARTGRSNRARVAGLRLRAREGAATAGASEAERKELLLKLYVLQRLREGNTAARARETGRDQPPAAPAVL
jgi:hypothetical protein